MRVLPSALCACTGSSNSAEGSSIFPISIQLKAGIKPRSAGPCPGEQRDQPSACGSLPSPLLAALSLHSGLRFPPFAFVPPIPRNAFQRSVQSRSGKLSRLRSCERRESPSPLLQSVRAAFVRVRVIPELRPCQEERTAAGGAAPRGAADGSAKNKSGGKGAKSEPRGGKGGNRESAVFFFSFFFFCPEIRRSAVGSRAALPLSSSTQPPSHCPAANGARERPEVKGLGDFGTRSSGRSPPCVRGPFGCAVLSAAGDVQLRSPL